MADSDPSKPEPGDSDQDLEQTAPSVPRPKPSSAAEPSPSTGADSEPAIEATLPGTPDPAPSRPTATPADDPAAVQETAGAGHTDPGAVEATAGATPKAPRPPSDDSLVGTVLGGCKLLKKVGAGAMGMVYLAEQIRLERRVAVKIIRPELCQDELLVEQFKNEAIAGGSMKTPNVVQVYDVGYEKGLHFLVMEYIEGGNLKEHLQKSQRRQLLITEALDFMIQAARGLREAERLGIVHRDIKPDNLLLDQTQTIKIADFGISKVMGTDIGLTQSGQIKGTPLYMSPEQCKGETLDSRSDIYSLGATFYHLLTGEPPADGNTFFEVTKFKTEQEFLSLRRELKDAPASVSSIIEKMTALEVGDRYEGLDQLVKDLELAVRGQEPDIVRPPKRPVPAPEPEPGPAPGNPALLRVAIVLLLLLGGTYLVFREPVNAWINGVATAPDETPTTADPGDTAPDDPAPDDPAKAAFAARLASLRQRWRRNPQALSEIHGAETLSKELDSSNYDDLKTGGQELFASIRRGAEQSIDVQLENARADLDAGKDPTVRLNGLLDKVIATCLEARRQEIGALLRTVVLTQLRQRVDTLKDTLRGKGPSTALGLDANRLHAEIRENIQPEDPTLAGLVQDLVNNVSAGNRLKLTLAAPGAALPFEELEAHAKLVSEELSKLTPDSRQDLKVWAEHHLAATDEKLFEDCRGVLASHIEKREAVHAAAGNAEARIAALNATLATLRASQRHLLAAFPGRRELVESLLAGTIAGLAGEQTEVGAELDMVGSLRTDLLAQKARTHELDRVTYWWRDQAGNKLDQLRTRLDALPGEHAELEQALKDTLIRDQAWKAHAASIQELLREIGAQDLGQARSRQARLLEDGLEDADLGQLTAAIEALENGFTAATIRLDLSAATTQFDRAAASLRDFGDRAKTAISYTSRCLAAIKALTPRVDGMARVHGDSIAAEWHRAPVESFFLACREVTRREFAGFVAQLKQPHSAVEARWPGMFSAEGLRRFKRRHQSLNQQLNDDLPMEGLCYRDASAYARYINRELMARAQWWLAARGPASATRKYPWGEWAQGEEFRRQQLVPVNEGTPILAPGSGDKIYHLADNVAEFLRQTDPQARTARLVGGHYRNHDRARFSGSKLSLADGLIKVAPAWGMRTALCPADELAAIRPR